MSSLWMDQPNLALEKRLNGSAVLTNKPVKDSDLCIRLVVTVDLTARGYGVQSGSVWIGKRCW